MKKFRTNHMLDLLFPIALLFVFAVSAIAVLLFATEIYSDSVEKSSRNSVARTSIAYVTEKVHQSDEGGRIYADKLDSCDAIVISNTIDGQEYLTYIYVADGELRELFTQAGNKLDKNQGSKILEVQEMKIEAINSKLFRITCVDDKGKQASTIVGVRS